MSGLAWPYKSTSTPAATSSGRSRLFRLFTVTSAKEEEKVQSSDESQEEEKKTSQPLDSL